MFTSNCEVKHSGGKKVNVSLVEEDSHSVTFVISEGHFPKPGNNIVTVVMPRADAVQLSKLLPNK